MRLEETPNGAVGSAASTALVRMVKPLRYRQLRPRRTGWVRCGAVLLLAARPVPPASSRQRASIESGRAPSIVLGHSSQFLGDGGNIREVGLSLTNAREFDEVVVARHREILPYIGSSGCDPAHTFVASSANGSWRMAARLELGRFNACHPPPRRGVRPPGASFPAAIARRRELGTLFRLQRSYRSGSARWPGNHCMTKVPVETAAPPARVGDAERFQLLVQNVTDYAIYLLLPDGVVSSWNSGAERLKGYAAAEIIGQHFSRFFTEEDRHAGLPQRALATARREGRFESEGWRLRKDGTRFWANAVLDVVHAEDGTFIGFAKITRDLTERRASQQSLIDSERRFRTAGRGRRRLRDLHARSERHRHELECRGRAHQGLRGWGDRGPPLQLLLYRRRPCLRHAGPLAGEGDARGTLRRRTAGGCARTAPASSLPS